MRFPFLATLLALAACSPELNWREVRAEPTALTVLLPCKPDRGARVVPLAGRDTSLTMLGCDAGGATFAVAFADAPDAGQAVLALAQWRAATLANMRAGTPVQQAFAVAGGVAATRVSASGQRADGKPVQSQAVYFSQGPRVYQAVIYADRLPADVADTFFGGLRLP
ncbi:MAG: hypothetical protein AB7P37_07950 [Ramlibacter sp.]